MAQGDTPITVVGNLVADPELRFIPSGAAVANFRIASTPRTFNRETNQWEDGEALFLTCNCWRQMAGNVAESLTKGMRVVVTGKLRQRSYQTKEGENRTVFEVEVDEPLLEVSTDKVDTEIPSPVAGTLIEILAEEDDTVEVGDVIARIGEQAPFDQLQIQRLKKRKLTLRDRISYVEDQITPDIIA